MAGLYRDLFQVCWEGDVMVKITADHALLYSSIHAEAPKIPSQPLGYKASHEETERCLEQAGATLAFR